MLPERLLHHDDADPLVELAPDVVHLAHAGKPGLFVKSNRRHSVGGRCDDGDDFTRPGKSVIPAGVSIAPLGYLLVWADEETSQTQTNGDLHVNFKLSQTAEQIGLYDPAGRLIDSIVYSLQSNNVSQGRWPDGSGSLYSMPTPTPLSSKPGSQSRR